ncbi:ROK family protein [Ornithinimicrobium sp. W1665]|uniref:ROK family protein n=1 Tax=Ornithinimicrobium sp. W1665 TaxID=3416666 RepID=UPI003D6B75EB
MTTGSWVWASSFPVWVDHRTGTAVWSANLRWRDLPLRDLVTRASGSRKGVAVAVGHDVRAGLVGEHRFGAARAEQDVLFVALGTGLASALLVGGRLVVGSPWSGEIGHVVVRPGGPECGCGALGCLEAVAGAGALARRWLQITGRPGDAQVVAEQAAAGEPVAVELWCEAINALSAVLAPVVAATGTQLVLVGGGLSNAGAQLLGPLDTALHERLPGQRIRVARAGLGDRAAALGAAALALDEVSRNGRSMSL